MRNNYTSMKIALVTGSSRGLGRAIALRLAKEGHAIIIQYNSSQAEAEKVAEKIQNSGGAAFAVQADLSKVASIETMYATIDDVLSKRFASKQFDILVNNAGTAMVREQWTEADFDYQFDLNVKGLFFTTQLAIPRLRDGGRIINIGTGLTRFTYPPFAVYAASKGAVNVFTQYFAAMLGPRQITVNTLAPGAIDTDLNADWIRSEAGRQQVIAVSALKRVGMPEDIADAVAFLASEDSRWVTGQRIEASGGAHL